MSRPIKTIHNVETGEILEREFNDEEFAQYEADQAAYLAQKTEAQAKAEAQATAKAALLERLGITQAEADLLLS